jgi:peptide/nickel transport system permease protein
VLVRHALAASLQPIIALVALDIGMMFGGAVITETVFALPGMGRLLVDSVQARDAVVALDIVVLGALAIAVSTTIGDIVAGIVDPRQRDDTVTN